MTSNYNITLSTYLNFVVSSQQILNNSVNIIRNQEVILRNLLTELRCERINNEIRNIILSNDLDISLNNTPTNSVQSTPSNSEQSTPSNSVQSTPTNEIHKPNEELLNRLINESKIKRCKYCMVENKLNNKCPILGEEFTDNNDVIQIKHCNHIINEKEFIKWFNISKSCPLCKYNLDTNTYNTSITSLQDNSTNDISQFLENNIQNLLNNSQSFSIEYSLINPNTSISSRPLIRRSRYPVGVRRTTYDNSPS